ncbi:MAG: CDP-alcohol phosphatidyltransferase family protein [Clostridiales bacterium]|nr:CDP-alcohol phosphatidyltransferase family protein [Clostridiales bacterium]
MKFDKKEFFTIPNIMGYFRIILIPIFTYLYFSATSTQDYYIVATLVLISTITDFFDGKIARKFNQVSEFGKFLDPVADKMTHFALVICLMSRYHYMYYLVALMVLKEGFMAVMGMIKLKKGKKLNGAMWFGKVCTATLFLCLLFLIMFPSIPLAVANGVIITCMVIMVFTLLMYIPVFARM